MVSHKPTKAKDAGEQLSLEKKALKKEIGTDQFSEKNY
jgi:hypothetical protein